MFARQPPPIASLLAKVDGLVAPSGSAGRITTCPRRSGKEKALDYQGFLGKRLKGLEPSTFCMASRRSSQLSYSREAGEYTRRWRAEYTTRVRAVRGSGLRTYSRMFMQ